MSRQGTVFACGECGYIASRWLGRCPECGQYNTLVEEISTAPAARGGRRFLSAQAGPISEISVNAEERFSTGSGELDRVLGGGIVGGSLVLLGGEPGIGKSTLLLQCAAMVAAEGRKVLLVSGEESGKQVRLRADRLGAVSDSLFLLPEVDLEAVETAIGELKPSLVIVDSIQTVSHPEITSAPGSVAQVRECAAALMRLAKTENIPVFLVGHVTKDGAIAGPRVLEHMVDTVLYFEGDSHRSWRLLRAVKNRFGPSNELAVFEMVEEGLRGVENPSLLLSSNQPAAPGCVVAATMEGTRPILMEVQALLNPSYLASPRRITSGIDLNRLLLVIAVLERRIGARLAQQDIYLSVAGGIRVNEPAVDLAVAAAIVSALGDNPVAAGTALCGEVGLSGEIRNVARVAERIKEAARLGFNRVIVPASSESASGAEKQIQIYRVETLQQALGHLS